MTNGDLWPFFVYLGAVVALTLGMMGFSYALGQRHSERATGEAYESGILPTGDARIRFDVKFFLIAMFFLIFDVETVFIVVWAVALREAGWMGYVDICVFIAVLLAALAYLWRLGALDWAGLSRRKRNIDGRNI